MRKVKIVLGVALLSAVMAGDLAFANMPGPGGGGGAICGAWEPTGGAGSTMRRLCIDGSLTWYEYQ